MGTKRILRDWRASALVAIMIVAATCGSALAQEVPIVTGSQWMQSSDATKKVYLIGVANALQIEAAYEGGNPPSDAQSLVPRFTKGMKGQTLDSVREGLDKYYSANPDKLQRPVIETIWFEMVAPGLKK